MVTKKLKAPDGHHWMKKGNLYKLMKHTGKFKAHKGASLTATFQVIKTHGTKTFDTKKKK